jgi:hypothetical protein
LDEIREQIFGCLDNDLHDFLGEYIQEILEEAMEGEAEGDHESPPSAGVDGKGAL